MIYVFGGSNLDLNIKIKDDIKLFESNPADITIKHGGVGRNVARSIGNYTSCEFITCVPNRPEYLSILEELSNHNVSFEYSLIQNKNMSSIYVNVLNNDDLYLGASDTKTVESIKLSDIDPVLNVIEDDSICFIDANFTSEFINYVLDKSKGIKIFDAVSSKKLQKVREVLYKFDYIKVNKYEYETIKDLNLKNLIITYGNGIKIIKDDKVYEVTHKLYNPINTTGCGDSFFGAFIANINKGIKEAIEDGIVAAIASSQTNENVPTIEEIEKINKEDLEIVWKD